MLTSITTQSRARYFPPFIYSSTKLLISGGTVSARRTRTVDSDGGAHPRSPLVRLLGTRPAQ
jgi:hypothetical protein